MKRFITSDSILKNMEFQDVKNFFTSLQNAKRRYPMIVTYLNKHLNKLTTFEEMEREVNLFKTFLINNASISESKFDDPEFKTGKSSFTLMMNNFLTGNSETDDVFWKELQNLEKLLFKGDKPEKGKMNKLNGAMAAFEGNPIMMDVMEQVKDMKIDVIKQMKDVKINDMTDFNSIMANPEFRRVVNNIKGNISSKLQRSEYSVKDLTGTVLKVIDTIKGDLDEETINALNVMKETVTAVENNQQIDMAKIMAVVGNLRLN